MTWRILQGDCREVLRTLPADSVQCCVTSPPYWGLRDYGVEGQFGLERTPEEYVAKMVEVFREVRRVLRPDGTLWLNLGDSYCSAPAGNAPGTQGAKSGLTNPWRMEEIRGRHKEARSRGENRPETNGAAGTLVQPNRTTIPGLKPKDLVGIPWRVALALQADGWWLRQEIIWHKPNPMPEAVTDRPTRSHEQVFLLSRSASYFYDRHAIMEPVTGGAHPRGGGVNPKALESGSEGREGRVGAPRSKQNASFSAAVTGLVAQRNRRSVWSITTKPYPGAHFATFPVDLVEPCILAGSSERGACASCGAPLERVVETPDFSEQPKRAESRLEGKMIAKGAGYATSAGQAWQDWRAANPDRTVDWRPTCSCEPGGGKRHAM